MRFRAHALLLLVVALPSLAIAAPTSIPIGRLNARIKLGADLWLAFSPKTAGVVIHEGALDATHTLPFNASAPEQWHPVAYRLLPGDRFELVYQRTDDDEGSTWQTTLGALRAEVHFFAARKAHLAAEYDQASAEIARALVLLPSDGEAQMEELSILIDQKHVDRAREILRTRYTKLPTETLIALLHAKPPLRDLLMPEIAAKGGKGPQFGASGALVSRSTNTAAFYVHVDSNSDEDFGTIVFVALDDAHARGTLAAGKRTNLLPSELAPFEFVAPEHFEASERSTDDDDSLQFAKAGLKLKTDDEAILRGKSVAMRGSGESTCAHSDGVYLPDDRLVLIAGYGGGHDGCTSWLARKLILDGKKAKHGKATLAK